MKNQTKKLFILNKAISSWLIQDPPKVENLLTSLVKIVKKKSKQLHFCRSEFMIKKFSSSNLSKYLVCSMSLYSAGLFITEN